MTKEKKLYSYIIYTLYNLFLNNNLKIELNLNNEFKEKTIRQLCIMLTLEKEFDVDLNGKKWTLLFAQVFSNIINKSEIIEKIDSDKIIFNLFDEDYLEYIKYICENFNIKKYDLTKENVISIDLLKKCSYFNLDNNKKKENKNIEENININNDNKDHINFNNNNNIINNIDNKILENLKNIPIHPKFDPRFYPYNSKPKYIYLYKKIFYWIIIFVSLNLIILWILSSQLKFNIDIKVISYKINDNYIIVGGGKDWYKHNNNLNFENNKKPFLSLKMLGMTGNQINAFFGGLLPIVSIFYMFYEIFGFNNNLKKDKYIVKISNIIIPILILFYSYFSFSNFLLSNYIYKMLLSFSVPINKGIIIQNDELIFGKLLTPDSDLLFFLENISKIIKNTFTYKIIYFFTFFSLILIIIVLIFSIILIIISPKLDRKKILLANQEYEKALTASFKGEIYKINESLFDNEFEEKNNKKNNNKLFVFFKKNKKNKKKSKN